MDLFSKYKKSPLKVVFKGFTDWHCHILPGVDDGIRTLEDSLLILDRYEKAGVKNVVLTPHIMEDIPNTTDELRATFEKLKNAYTGSINLILAAENMIDTLLYKRLQADDLLLLPGRKLLVETSYFNPPVDLMGTLMAIKKAGYTPVLAHPERYVYMSRKQYEEIFDENVEFQMNLPALAGFFGREVKARAEWLLKEDFYTLCGTDLHRKSQFQSLLGSEVRRTSLKQLQESILEVSNNLL